MPSRLRVALVSVALLEWVAPTALAWPEPPRDRPARLVLPRVDVDRLTAEDAATVGLELPQRVGEALEVDLSPADSGTWQELEGGAARWRLEVASEGARWLVLGFGRLHLGPGAWLSVRGVQPGVELGPYRAEDARAHGRFWLPPLAGDTARIELFWPASLRDVRPDVRLESVARGYRSAWGAPQGEERSGDGVAAACNVDVNCPAGDGLQEQKRGIVQLLIAGSRLCSGSLVNTTAGDCRPYVLTAAHCLRSDTDPSATLFRFAYERELCENGSAPTANVLYGSALRAAHASSDFALLELDQPPPAEFEPYFLGWSRSASAPAASWCIHHAGGGPKKLSHDADPAVSGQSTGWGTSHWRVLDWEEGTTEPGSSGAPLLDPAGRVVGQLHGGTADCRGGWDEFGKLANSWSGGGTPGTRLSDWLDPLRRGATAVAGIDGGACRRHTEREQPRPRPLSQSRDLRSDRRSLPR